MNPYSRSTAPPLPELPKRLEIGRFPLGRSREIKGDQGRSREIKGDQGRSREIKGDQGRSREIKGDQGRSREIKGDQGVLDCTPKVRQKVKGPNTLNGERYGFGPTNIQPR